jgi:hypothetical protein
MIKRAGKSAVRNYFSDSRKIGTNLPSTIILKGGAGNQEKSILHFGELRNSWFKKGMTTGNLWGFKTFITNPQKTILIEE